LFSSLAQTDATGKAVDREGHHYAAGISREDFRRAGDISGDVQADTTLMQHEPNSKFFVDATNRLK
jgi:hypothetical protein